MLSDFNQLFYEDSYKQTFDAKVQDHKTIDGKPWIKLDQTLFYPEGGGQPGDTGTLTVSDKTVLVLDTQVEDNVIWHQVETLEDLPIDRSIRGAIDWERRYDFMQQHSAEHIYSGLVNKHFGYDNVGFHLNERFMTIDFSGPLSQAEVMEMETLANLAITKNLPFEITYHTPKEAKEITYRSKLDLTDTIRLVTVPGVDRCACCGTQVRNTGEIGLLKVTNVMNYKGGVRLELLAGMRAIIDYQKKHNDLKDMGAQLSSPTDEVLEYVKALIKDRDDLQAETTKLSRRLVDVISDAWPEQFQTKSAITITDLSADSYKDLAKTFSTKTDALSILLGLMPDESIRFSISGTKEDEVKDLLENLKTTFAAKGGGRGTFISGQIAKDISIDAVKEYLRDLDFKLY